MEEYKAAEKRAEGFRKYLNEGWRGSVKMSELTVS